MNSRKSFENNLTGSNDQANNEILTHLDALQHVPERDPQRAQASREAYLAQARDLQPTVSQPQKSRHIGWTNIFKKERSPMYSLARIILVAAIALGGTGATAYAAHESLPDQTLYPVKTWIEDLRLGLATSQQAEFNLLLRFADERIEEIETMLEEDLQVQQEVNTRLHQHLQQMLKIAAEMEDPAMMQAMEQVRVQSQVQIQRLEKLKVNTPEDAQALELATQAMHNIRNSAEDAIQDPETFRLRQGTNRPDEAPDVPENEPYQGDGEDPANGQGQGPQRPNNGNGPGK